MKIIAVDPFYLKMPQITDAADGTQDTLVVRIQTDEGITGWGECDASPLVSLAAYCCPMSHGNIINIRESLIGETLDNPDDVVRLHQKALRNGLDIQQIHHAYSGADIALWDIVGQKLGEPIYRLLEPQSQSHSKLPYASVLFGDTPKRHIRLQHSCASKGIVRQSLGGDRWGNLEKRTTSRWFVRHARVWEKMCRS